MYTLQRDTIALRVDMALIAPFRMLGMLSGAALSTNVLLYTGTVPLY